MAGDGIEAIVCSMNNDPLGKLRLLFWPFSSFASAKSFLMSDHSPPSSSTLLLVWRLVVDYPFHQQGRSVSVWRLHLGHFHCFRFAWWWSKICWMCCYKSEWKCVCVTNHTNHQLCDKIKITRCIFLLVYGQESQVNGFHFQQCIGCSIGSVTGVSLKKKLCLVDCKLWYILSVALVLFSCEFFVLLQ